VNDAINADSDHAIDRLKEDLRNRKINYTEITKPDPVNAPDRVVLKGVPPESRSDLMSIVNERLPEFDVSSGTENTCQLTLKQHRKPRQRTGRSVLPCDQEFRGFWRGLAVRRGQRGARFDQRRSRRAVYVDQ